MNWLKWYIPIGIYTVTCITLLASLITCYQGKLVLGFPLNKGLYGYKADTAAFVS